MSAHTPGPWVISHDDEALFSDSTLKSVRIAHHEGGAIADAYINCLVNTDEACRSNAHLIAAAPDLLAALRGVLRVADRATDEFDAARAAIAKATGGPA